MPKLPNQEHEKDAVKAEYRERKAVALAEWFAEMGSNFDPRMTRDDLNDMLRKFDLCDEDARLVIDHAKTFLRELIDQGQLAGQRLATLERILASESDHAT